MKTLSIVKIGNPVLREKARAVSFKEIRSARFRRFLKQMVAAMRAGKGVGLAANQVGAAFRVIVLESRKNPRYPDAPDFPLEILINPRIAKYSPVKETGWEGCLSVPGYRGLVTRSKAVVLEALSSSGVKLRKNAEGFYARVLQHEIDHLNGLLYVDRMKNLRNWHHLDEYDGQS